MARQFKFACHIRSKPGLSHPFRSIITVRAETEDEAKKLAVEKAADSNPKYSKRRQSMFWIIDFIQEV